MGRNKNGSGMALVLLLAFIFMAAQDSNASLLSHFQKLGNNNNNNNNNKISPAPAPALAPAPLLPDPAINSLSAGNCTSSMETCKDKAQINITACLISSSNVKNELFLLIQNQEESSVEVSVTTNTTSQIIPIPKHGIKKVNVTDERSSTIVLKSGNNNACVIHLKPPEPGKSFFGHFPYQAGYAYATPLNGVYLLALTALILVGTWACCVMGKNEKRVDGAVKYQELEMGRAESPSSGPGVGDTEDRWDQGWDDDEWGEIKAVRSPKARQNGNGLNNSSRSLDSTDGWENTWDD